MYAIEVASGGMIYTKSHEDWHRRTSNIKVISQKF
jgi:hypothetical protein